MKHVSCSVRCRITYHADNSIKGKNSRSDLFWVAHSFAVSPSQTPDRCRSWKSSVVEPLSLMSAWLSLSMCQINVKNSKGGFSVPPLYKKGEHLKTQKERRLGLQEAQSSTHTLYLTLFIARHTIEVSLWTYCASKKIKKWSAVAGDGLPLGLRHHGRQETVGIKSKSASVNEISSQYGGIGNDFKGDISRCSVTRCPQDLSKTWLQVLTKLHCRCSDCKKICRLCLL